MNASLRQRRNITFQPDRHFSTWVKWLPIDEPAPPPSHSLWVWEEEGKVPYPFPSPRDKLYTPPKIAKPKEDKNIILSDATIIKR